VIMMTASCGKHNVTLWRPSVCILSVTHQVAACDSASDYRPDNKEERHICSTLLS